MLLAEGLVQVTFTMQINSLDILSPTCCCQDFKGSNISVVSSHNVPFCDIVVPLGQAARSNKCKSHCRP